MFADIQIGIEFPHSLQFPHSLAERGANEAIERAQKEKEDAERRVNEAQEAIERIQKEIAALKVTSGGGSNANANSDRFQPKANQS